MTTLSSPSTPLLNQTLARAARRIRAIRGLRWGAWGLLGGSIASLSLILAQRVHVLDSEIFADPWLLLPPLAGLMGGAIWGATRATPRLAVARLTEQRFSLQERLSTALTLGQRAASGEEWAGRQVADAESHAGALDLRTAYPLLRPLPRVVFAALGVSLAAFLAWFLPTLPQFQSPQERADHAAVRKEGERLVRVAHRLEAEAGQRHLERAKNAAQKLAALGHEMQRGKMSRQKALMKAAKLTDEMRRQQQNMASASSPSDRGEKSLAKAGAELEKALKASENQPKDGTSAANGNDPASDGSNADKNKTASSAAKGAIAQARQALSKNDSASLAEQLNKMADSAARGEPGDKAGREKMASQLRSLSKALEGTSLSPASEPLRKASEAMQKGDMAEASKQLREAAKRIQQAEGKSADAKALEQMANAMNDGKDASQSGDGSSEGSQLSDSGEGQGKDDAFGKDGLKNGRGKGKNGEQGQGMMGGDDPNGPPANGIGSSAGKVGGKKPPVTKGGAYLDAKNAPAENKKLNRKTQDANVRDLNGTRLFAPDGKSNNTRVQGKRGEKGQERVSYFRGAPDKANASTPYYEVYGRYAPAAESALNREDIPSSYKKQVRDYFDALRPDSKAATKK